MENNDKGKGLEPKSPESEEQKKIKLSWDCPGCKTWATYFRYHVLETL